MHDAMRWDLSDCHCRNLHSTAAWPGSGLLLGPVPGLLWLRLKASRGTFRFRVQPMAAASEAEKWSDLIVQTRASYLRVHYYLIIILND